MNRQWDYSQVGNTSDVLISLLMLVAQFASGRQQLPLSASHLIVETGGFTTQSHTLWVSLQGENQAGLNLLAPAIGPITIPAGSRLRVQLPEGFAKAAEKFYRYILSAHTEAVPIEFAQLAAIDLYTYSGGVLTAKQFPVSIVLDRDEHFALKASCNNIGQLPVNPVNGMCRRLIDLTTIYEFNEQLIWRNNTDFITTNPNGTWVRTGLFSTYVDDTTDSDGCDRALEDLGENVKRPIYQADNTDSIPTTFWLMNRGSDEIPQGERLGFTIEAGGEDVTEIASTVALLHFQLDGYVTNIAELDVTGENNVGSMPGAGFARVFQNKKTNFRLPKPLPVGQAVAITIWINTSTARTGGMLSQGAKIRVTPKNYAQSGSYEGSGLFFGDLIAPSESTSDGMGRVYPDIGLSVRVMQRSGCVDSYFFLDIPETTVYGLALNTANQYVGINGNGDVYLIPVGNTASASEAIRAIVGTVEGIGTSGGYSSYFAIAANSSLNFTLTYPYNTTLDLAQVRSDYPDIIAGEYANFNPAYAAIYIQRQSSGEIRRFEELVVPGVSQTFKIDNWDGGTIVSSLPVAGNGFGFFAPSVPTSLSETLDGVNFPADSYRVCFAFKYTASVTSLSHDSLLGCIEEAPIKVSELYALFKSWGDAIASNQIRLIPKGRTFRGQTRRLWDTGQEIYFDSTSFATDDGVTVFRPNWVAASEAGRWIVKPNTALTAEQILTQIKTVDGAGSGLDADLLDGQQASAFSLTNHTHADATTSASGFMSGADKAKLNGLDGSDFAPVVHTHGDATPTTSGFMSGADKTKLDGIATGGNYAPTNHTHADATTSASGFMSEADKTKLDGLNASNYASSAHTHANATTSASGFMSGVDKTKLDDVSPASATQKTFWAAPSGTNGAPSFRAIADSDLSSNIPKINTSNTFTKAQRSQIVTLSIVSGVVTLNPSDSNDFVVELSSSATLVISGGTASDSFRLTVVQTAIGGRILSLPSGTLTPNGAQITYSSTPGSIDKLSFDSHNGTTWACSWVNLRAMGT